MTRSFRSSAASAAAIVCAALFAACSHQAKAPAGDAFRTAFATRYLATCTSGSPHSGLLQRYCRCSLHAVEARYSDAQIRSIAAGRESAQVSAGLRRIKRTCTAAALAQTPPPSGP